MTEWSAILAREFRRLRASISDDDWPGYLHWFDERHRVILGRAADVYIFQRRDPDRWREYYKGVDLEFIWRKAADMGCDLATDHNVWQPSRLWRDVRRGQMAVACGLGVGLPALSRREYWLDGAYERVLSWERNYRLVVDLTGHLFGFQRKPWVVGMKWPKVTDDGWITQATAASLADLQEGARFLEFVDHDFLERFERLLDGVPEVAADSRFYSLPPFTSERLDKRLRARAKLTD